MCSYNVILVGNSNISLSFIDMIQSSFIILSESTHTISNLSSVNALHVYSRVVSDKVDMLLSYNFEIINVEYYIKL